MSVMFKALLVSFVMSALSVGAAPPAASEKSTQTTREKRIRDARIDAIALKTGVVHTGDELHA